MGNVDKLAMAIVEKVLQDVERIAATGRLDGMEEVEQEETVQLQFDGVSGICDFLRGWYGLPPAN
ncbi:hypothetical protein [uncultured Oscillibacter sp.]|uniref:hypothetical protein n=1 Tax=uncultured Oscillibacter sp. TaxID=876091 RepID=UPI0026058679|nr:hypothetical protein [uncultured Oscillibacter sp.]